MFIDLMIPIFTFGDVIKNKISQSHDDTNPDRPSNCGVVTM